MTEREQRAALDHVLALIADAPWSASLVLRGSMTMPAWVGDAARPPGDLDWIVLEEETGVDPEDPYPYAWHIEDVQQWPEAFAGAAGYDLWREEEFGTGGERRILPPEGLSWVDSEDVDPSPPYHDLVERIRDRPYAGAGVVLDAAGARDEGNWTYAGYDIPGVRLSIPWRTEHPGTLTGAVQLDFARDEFLPEPPVWTLVPRAGGHPPTPVRTASRELSLAWKLLWLRTDAATEGRAQAKDLYDAVLLAESPRTRLGPRLLRRVLGAFDPASVTDWDVEWPECASGGHAGQWLDRLRRALEHPARDVPGGA
ncbi:nucleotidyl transferase AbiEii/AbiGii toxin family protein [Streptomyces sp. S6]